MVKPSNFHFPAWFISFKDGLAFIGVIIGLLVLAIASHSFYNIYLHPLRKYPGPKLASASGFVNTYYILTGNEVAWVTALHKQYGEIVRTGPDRLSYIKPDAWKDIAGPTLGKRAENTKDKKWYGGDSRGYRSTAFIVDNEVHRPIRSTFKPAFSDRGLKLQEPLIHGHVNSLVQLIRTTLEEHPNSAIDISKMFNFVTFDIVSDLTFGEPLGLLKTSKYTSWIQGFNGNIRWLSMSRVFLEHKIIGILVNVFKPKALYQFATLHRQNSETRMQKRLEKGNDPEKPDFWKLIMDKNEEQLNIPYGQMVAIAGGLMLAGTETTATLLSGMMFLLLKNPEALQKVKDEVRALAIEDLNMEVLARLEYMNYCISEAFRFYPPAAIGMPRVVPKGGNVICGQVVPEGTRVAVSHYAAYHSPANFKDPDLYIPERWQPNSGYESDRRNVVNPFSVGPRNCIGQNLANHEIRIILASLIWNFDFELSPECDNWLNQKVYMVWEKPELMVKVKCIR